MSVQTNTSVQLSPQISTNTTPSQFLDQAIALETLKLMDKTINNGKWTWAVVGTVFFILSLDGVKRVIINLVDKSITYLCNMTGDQWSNLGSTIIYPVKMVGKGISLPFRYAYKKINPEIKVNEYIPPKTYPLDCNEGLWKMLYTRPEFSFDTEIISIKHIGSEIQQTERWRDMKIISQDFSVYFEGNIDVIFTIKSTTACKTLKLFTSSSNPNEHYESLFKYDESIIDMKAPSFDEYDKLINPYIKDCIFIRYIIRFNGFSQVYHEVIPGIKYIPSSFHGIVYNAVSFCFCGDKKFFLTFSKHDNSTYVFNCSINYGKNAANLFVYSDIVEGLMKIYASNQNDPEYFGFYIFILFGCIGDNVMLYKYIMKLKFIYSFGGTCMMLDANYIENKVNIKDGLKEMKKIFDEFIFKGIPPKVVHDFKRWVLMKSGVVTKTKSPEIEEQKVGQNTINFYTDKSPVEFTNWLTKISTEVNSEEDKDIDSLKIKANYIKVEKSVKKESVKNPEYDIWMETAKEMRLFEKDDDKKSNVQINTNFFDKMPSQFLTEVKNVTEIKCENVNSIYKGINTLYLQETDYHKLFNSLDNFKNRKQLLQELGFPLKLGILLHGPPGTGKSATILAVASYLQKDLYYVDLRSVKTNGDLKMIFDHIMKMNINGGILVFEDIDCATKTVLKRENEIASESTINALSNEDNDFTLDYFLNILQGTLTRDNTIFIMTTNFVNKLDSALIRDGRIDVNIEMKLTNKEQLIQMWKTIFKREVTPEVLNNFEEFVHKPATILSRLAQYLTTGDEIDDKLILEPFLKCSINEIKKEYFN
jgi:hypothetical protein